MQDGQEKPIPEDYAVVRHGIRSSYPMTWGSDHVFADDHRCNSDRIALSLLRLRRRHLDFRVVSYAAVSCRAEALFSPLSEIIAKSMRLTHVAEAAFRTSTLHRFQLEAPKMVA